MYFTELQGDSQIIVIASKFLLGSQAVGEEIE